MGRASRAWNALYGKPAPEVEGNGENPKLLRLCGILLGLV